MLNTHNSRIMKRTFLSFVLCCFSLYSWSQAGKVDSVLRLISLHPQNDSIRVNLLNELSNQNIGVNYYFARKHAEEAMELAEKLSYTKGIADANNKLALSLWSLGENDLAIKYALRAVKIIERDHFPEQMLAESYRALGFAYMEMREIGKAESYLNKATQICLRNNNWRLRSKIYMGKTMIKYLKNEMDSAEFFELKSYTIMEVHKDSFNTALLKYLKASDINDPQLAIADLDC